MKIDSILACYSGAAAETHAPTASLSLDRRQKAITFKLNELSCENVCYILETAACTWGLTTHAAWTLYSTCGTTALCCRS